jgi:hypothetical protein
VPQDAASVGALRDVMYRFYTLDIQNTHSGAPSRAKRWANVPAMSSRVAYWLTVRDHRRREALLILVEPGEVRLLAMEEPRDGLNQHVIGGSGVETTGFFEGQNPFDPAVALGTRRPVGTLPPEDAKPQGPFRPVMRRFDPVLRQKDPQRVHLPQQATGKPSSVETSSTHPGRICGMKPTHLRSHIACGRSS